MYASVSTPGGIGNHAANPWCPSSLRHHHFMFCYRATIQKSPCTPMSTRRWRVGLAVFTACTLACGRAPKSIVPAPLGGVAAARLARLSLGVNVSEWFNSWGKEKPPFDHGMSDNDLAAIRRLGFTVVRLIVDPRNLRDSTEPGVLDPRVLGYLDHALDRLIAHDLAIIVTPISHGRFFVRDSASAAAFAQFWEALARSVSHLDPDRLFLEAANEPPLTPGAWEPFQAEILAAMRRGAPRHTLIATGGSWSTVSGLVAIRPVPDPNVVYTFHVYEPWLFTHQGVPWNGEGQLANLLPYPMDTTRCKSALAQVTDSLPLTDARDYCAGRWDAGVIADMLDRAMQWRETHGVPLFAGELGAYCKAPSPDRLRWFRDVRVELEQRGIGWALWAWEGCFGLDARHGDDGRLVVDTAVIRALGLRP